MSDASERFWSKVRKSDGCWEWTAGRFEDGYGQFWLDGRPRKAHRVSFEMAGGVIPDGLEIDHLCRNRPCVNPDHLEPVTHQENMIRRAASITHCPRGHEYTTTSAYVSPRGTRNCRECDRQRRRARYNEPESER